MIDLKTLLQPSAQCLEDILGFLGHISLNKRHQNAYSIAQKTNFWKITVRLYEKWRFRSTELLTQKALNFEQECQLMQEWLSLQPYQVILDVGCSTGLYSRRLKSYADTMRIPIQIVGIDISPRFVQFANGQINREQLQEVRMYVMDTTVLPFRNQTFDRIVIGGSFNEIAHYLKAIKEWYRVLKEGGLLFSMNLVYTQKKNLLMRALSLSGIHIHTAEEMKLLFEEVGFRQIKSQVYHYLQLALYQK